MLQRQELDKPKTAKTILTELGLDETKFYVFSEETKQVIKPDEEVSGKIVIIPKIAGG